MSAWDESPKLWTCPASLGANVRRVDGDRCQFGFVSGRLSCLGKGWAMTKLRQLKKKTLEVTVWDYDRFSSNDFLGEVLIDLSNTSHFDNTLRWYLLKDQAESIDQAKPHSGQSSQQSPKHSVIKSRSHGIFPDPSKEMHVPTIEKSQSSPVSSKSSSEGHLRSHGPSRSQSKTSVTQTHLEDAGAAIAAAEAAVQQLRLQPSKRRK